MLKSSAVEFGRPLYFISEVVIKAAVFLEIPLKIYIPFPHCGHTSRQESLRFAYFAQYVTYVHFSH